MEQEIGVNDIDLVCGDCKLTFQWLRGEQRFMQGLHADGKIKEVTTPKRCPECRERRKQTEAQHEYHGVPAKFCGKCEKAQRYGAFSGKY